MKIAFLYAGQGSQYVGLGKDLYENYPVFAQSLDKIDVDGKIKELCFNGPIEELSKTRNTQPCMVAVAVSITNLLKSYEIYPEMTAGLSLGEYSALNCAGVFGDEQAVSLVRFRGEQMEKAATGLDSAMFAILGLTRELLLEACEKSEHLGTVSIANYNCPGQLVIAGERVATENASKLALELGAKRAIELNVSGPFHTKLMKPAGDALKERFLSENFGKMQVPVVFNTTGKEIDFTENIADLLEKQVQSSVYFEDSIRYMIDSGVDTFIEIGGGKVLSGFIKKISKEVKFYVLEDAKTLEILLLKIKGETIC